MGVWFEQTIPQNNECLLKSTDSTDLPFPFYNHLQPASLKPEGGGSAVGPYKKTAAHAAICLLNDWLGVRQSQELPDVPYLLLKPIQSLIERDPLLVWLVCPWFHGMETLGE